MKNFLFFISLIFFVISATAMHDPHNPSSSLDQSWFELGDHDSDKIPLSADFEPDAPRVTITYPKKEQFQLPDDEEDKSNVQQTELPDSTKLVDVLLGNNKPQPSMWKQWYEYVTTSPLYSNRPVRYSVLAGTTALVAFAVGYTVVKK